MVAAYSTSQAMNTAVHLTLLLAMNQSTLIQLVEAQLDDGGFANNLIANSQDAAKVMVALSAPYSPSIWTTKCSFLPPYLATILHHERNIAPVRTPMAGVIVHILLGLSWTSASPWHGRADKQPNTDLISLAPLPT